MLRKAARVEPNPEPLSSSARFLYWAIAQELFARLNVPDPGRRRIAPCFALSDLPRRRLRHALKMLADVGRRGIPVPFRNALPRAPFPVPMPSLLLCSPSPFGALRAGARERRAARTFTHVGVVRMCADSARRCTVLAWLPLTSEGHALTTRRGITWVTVLLPDRAHTRAAQRPGHSTHPRLPPVFAESPGTLDHGVVSVGGAASLSDVALCHAGESTTRGSLTSFDCPQGQTYNRPLTPSTDATSHLSSVTDSVTRERGFPHADAIRHR